MKTKTFAILTAALALAGAGCSENGKDKLTLNGAGASFPAPVYQNWTHAYSQSNPGIEINYQSLGSGAGISQIKEKTIDFAGTDNPLTTEELKKSGLRQFPMLTGGVVIIANVPGIPPLAMKLDADTLAGLFLGTIKNWKDERIAKLNPDLVLPDLPVTVVHRADASGTSLIFTDYLCKVSSEWKKSAGRGTSVRWPAGIGGQKNPGVCNNVAKIRGAVGYTEYTYAVEAKLPMVLLKNKAGNFVRPEMETFRAAASSADWKNAPGLQIMLTDPEGKDSWPIAGVTYILFREDCPPAKKQALIRYFEWCFDTGSAAAAKLNYVPIPGNVRQIIQNEVF